MSQSGIVVQQGGILPPEVATSYIADVGVAVPAANILYILGGAGISTNAVGDTLTIIATSTGFTWNTVTSVSPTNPIQIIANNGYICSGSSLVTLLLPLAPNVGDTFIVLSLTSRFEITQNGFQIIQIGGHQSTPGSGNATSNVTGDFMELVYVGSNIFMSFAPQGTISLN